MTGYGMHTVLIIQDFLSKLTLNNMTKKKSKTTSKAQRKIEKQAKVIAEIEHNPEQEVSLITSRPGLAEPEVTKLPPLESKSVVIVGDKTWWDNVCELMGW
jgi:hypothetical protein